MTVRTPVRPVASRPQPTTLRSSAARPTARPARPTADRGARGGARARVGRPQGRPGRAGATGPRHEVRSSPELLVHLGEHRVVALDDPAGHLLIPGPGRVLHQRPPRLGPGVLGRGPNSVVVVAIDPNDRRAFARDVRRGLGQHHRRHEDRCGRLEVCRHPRHRAPMVAIGGRDEDGRPALQDARAGPRRPEHLEGRQAQAGRFVLDEHPADAELRCETGQIDERGGCIAGEGLMERSHLGRGHHGHPVSRSRIAVPGRHRPSLPCQARTSRPLPLPPRRS